ncbi:DUF7096 domain-containing protein [Haladaptatus caseinilyticus]|uniref:DUF7096 domain-containing protein n=1 Tax=Haladaptatus caseinilyticus TaxID=2993314 RepID=UPI00224ABA9C|nr:hypothetical protein [Haladaptatus caseinilyticus]
MHAIRAVLLATLTVCGFAVALPTAAAPSSTEPANVSPNAFQTDQNTTSSNSTLGAEISSFMQVSTSQTKGTVDTGLWVARFNNTENRSARQSLVRHQVADLETELEDVRQRKQALVEARNNGEISTLRYQARMSEIVGEIRSLENAINETKPRAEKVGVGNRKLRNMSEQTKTVGGPEISEVARSLRSVSVPGENANNSTNTPGVGNGNGSNGSAIGTTPGNDNTSNGNIGVGNGNSSGGIGNGKNGNS